MQLNMLLIALLVGLFPSRNLDKVKIKGGKTYKGKITYIDGNIIEMQTKRGDFTFKRRRVKKMKVANINKRIPTKSLGAHYKFNADTKDATSNDNHGKLKNAKRTRDRFGKKRHAYYFDGQRDFIKVKSDKSLKSKRDLTISAWVKPDDVHTWHQLVYKGLVKHASFKPSYSLGTSGDYHNEWQFCISDSKKGQPICLNSKETIDPNRWTFLAATYDGKEMKLYINGQLRATKLHKGKIKHKDLPLFIGAKPSDKQGFKGIMDDVRIYCKTLDAKDIRTLYFLSE